MRFDVLNGVNLNVLARRNPQHYGGLSLDQLETQIYAWAKELGCEVRCRQTNSEEEYVEWCHDAAESADGVIVNAGAWAHFNYAIRDALELIAVPIVEVHLSNVDEREEWRRLSVISDLAAQRIVGKGPEGYRLALVFLVGAQP